jgi:hypothetical protein
MNIENPRARLKTSVRMPIHEILTGIVSAFRPCQVGTLVLLEHPRMRIFHPNFNEFDCETLIKNTSLFVLRRGVIQV